MRVVWGSLFFVGLVLTLTVPMKVAAQVDDDSLVIIIRSENVYRFPTCSRRGPKLEEVSSFWTPNQSLVDKIEEKLPKYYDEFIRTDEYFGHDCFGQFPRKTEDLDEFYRQYFGYSVGGVDFIYINFYPRKYFLSNWPEEELEKRKQFLQDNLSYVCDGGRLYWGLEYRVSDGSFQNANFNGGGGIICSDEQEAVLRKNGFWQRKEKEMLDKYNRDNPDKQIKAFGKCPNPC